MSDNRPSIAELKKLIAGWPVRWRPALGEEGEWDGFWWCRDKNDLEDRVSADTSEDYANDLAVFLAELVNSAPALFEVVAAALAWQTDPLELRNHRELVAALAKVRP